MTAGRVGSARAGAGQPRPPRCGAAHEKEKEPGGAAGDRGAMLRHPKSKALLALAIAEPAMRAVIARNRRKEIVESARLARLAGHLPLPCLAGEIPVEEAGRQLRRHDRLPG